MVDQVFLSYARSDGRHAKRLYEQLRKVGNLHVWFDQEDLPPGMRWRPAVRKAIRESRYFIGLLSKTSAERKGFQTSELREALEIMNEFPDDQIFLIPTRLEECAPPIQALEELNYADLFPDWDAGFRRLCMALGIARKESKREPAKAKKRSLRRASRRKKEGAHYRISLAKLDEGVAGLPTLSQSLNRIQSFFRFEPARLTPTKRALRKIDGEPHLDVARLGPVFYKRLGPLDKDHVFGITKRFLAFEHRGYEYANYLGAASPVDERVMFTSTCGLEEHARAAGVALPQAMAYMLVADLTWFFLDIDFHDEIRGCPMDFTEDHSSMVDGLAAGRFCRDCSRRLEKNAEFKVALEAMLGWER